MGLLTLVEDRPTPKAVYNWRVYCSAAVAASAAMMIGYDSAFIGGTLALSSFTDEFSFDDKSDSEVSLLKANIVSCYQAGAFFGAFFAYPIGHFFGRKKGLALFSMVFVLGAGMMLGASGSRGLGLIYGGRVLAGVGVGAASNLSPIYCAEIAPPAIRGRLVGLYEMSWQIGGLVGFWINYGVNETMEPSHEQWIIPFAVQLIPAGLLFAGSFLIKESPRWLFSRGRREEGIKNLCWLRKLTQDDLYMQEEIFAIDNAIESQRSTIGMGFWQPFRSIFTNQRVRYRLLLGGSLFFWQNATGKSICFPRHREIILTSSRYQCHQLLLSYSLQVNRHYRYQYLIAHNRHLRCHQDPHHTGLAFLPDRQAWSTMAPHVRCRRRLSLHVVHRWLHCRLGPCFQGCRS